MSKAPENILIIKPSSLGDIVLALPALSSLRRNFPGARISWLVRPEFAPLLKGHPHLTDIVLFDRKVFGRAWFQVGAFICLLSLIRQLRSRRFDVIIDLQGLFRTASLAWLSGCKKRFGTSDAREFSHLFYTHIVPQSTACTHLVDYYLKVIQAVGASDIAVQFLFPADSAAADSAKRLLSAYKINPGNYVVFVPGSVHTDKCWPLERFAALADKITSQFGLPVVATGTQSEKPLLEKLKTIASVPITNFAGLTNLGELTALLKNARLVVSNDTGPGHIAAALGTPLVMIFGRSNPARLAPYCRSRCVAAVDPNGRGPKRSSTDSKYNIKAISIDEVYQKVCEQITAHSM